MKVSNIEQVVTHDEARSRAGLGQASRQIKCVSPTTFSQKLYKHAALDIAQECVQAIEEDSLEKLKDLLNKLVALSA